MLITEQLPNLVREQVKAISDLRIDKVTVWDSGAGADGKNSTASFASGLIGALPPLHELAKNAGLELPEYLGKLVEEARERSGIVPATRPEPPNPPPHEAPPASEPPEPPPTV